MNASRFHQRLLDNMESELAEVGCRLTPPTRDRMARVLDCLDRSSVDDTDELMFELSSDFRCSDDFDEPPRQFGMAGCPPARWLPAAECA